MVVYSRWTLKSKIPHGVVAFLAPSYECNFNVAVVEFVLLDIDAYGGVRKEDVGVTW